MAAPRSPQMVPLVQVTDAFEVRLLTARLGAEGFLWELRGGFDGPYPLGAVTILVPADELAEASVLLLTDDVADALDGAAAHAAIDHLALDDDGDTDPVAPLASWRHRRLVLAAAGFGGCAVVVSRLFSGAT